MISIGRYAPTRRGQVNKRTTTSMPFLLKKVVSDYPVVPKVRPIPTGVWATLPVSFKPKLFADQVCVMSGTFVGVQFGVLGLVIQRNSEIELQVSFLYGLGVKDHLVVLSLVPGLTGSGR